MEHGASSGGIRWSWDTNVGSNREIEREVVHAIFLICALLFSISLSVNWYKGYGDTAFLSELTENIARTGFPSSQVVLSFEEHVPLLTTRAEDMDGVDLHARDHTGKNFFRIQHAYYILYLIAPLAWFVPVNLLLPSLTALSFLGMIYLFYHHLRRNHVPVAGAALFCLMVTTHPAWSYAIFGQLYVDRFFLILGSAFILSIAHPKPSLKRIILLGLLCALLSERVGVACALFAFSHTLLYWKTRPQATRRMILVFGLLLIIYSQLMITYQLKGAYATKGYSGFLSQPFLVLRDVAAFRKLMLFSLFNVTLLFFFGVMEWRTWIIAGLAMAPNIFGNIGGAEKVGWYTHYHSLYFPVLVWAAATGFIKLHAMTASKRQRRLLYAFIMVFTLAFSTIDPHSPDRLDINLSNMNEIAWMRMYRTFNDLFDGRGQFAMSLDQATQLRAAVPEHSIVSAHDSAIVALYKNRQLHYYPLGLEDADLVVIRIANPTTSPPTYFGAVSYLGKDELKRMDEYLVRRMETIGYDIRDPVVINGLAVIRNMNSRRLRSLAAE